MVYMTIEHGHKSLYQRSLVCGEDNVICSMLIHPVTTWRIGQYTQVTHCLVSGFTLQDQLGRKELVFT